MLQVILHYGVDTTRNFTFAFHLNWLEDARSLVTMVGPLKLNLHWLRRGKARHSAGLIRLASLKEKCVRIVFYQQSFRMWKSRKI